MSNYNKDRLTLIAIGQIYCAGNHMQADKNYDGLCANCQATIEATLSRTLQCPYDHAFNCQDCTIKCQTVHSNEEELAQSAIRTMMSYAAPRMLWRHPLMTLKYIARKIIYKQKTRKRTNAAPSRSS